MENLFVYFKVYTHVNWTTNAIIIVEMIAILIQRAVNSNEEHVFYIIQYIQ